MSDSENFKSLSKTTPSLKDLTTVKIDGHRYEYVHVPKCKICKSPDAIRNIIDSHIVMMRPYRDILNIVAPLYEKFGVEPKDMISYSSLTNHKARHLPMDSIAARSMMERRAAEENKLIMDGVETLLTAKGKIEPDMKTTLYAIEKLNEIENETTSTYKPEYLLGQLSVIIDAMREVLPPDMLDLVSKRIELKQGQLIKTSNILEVEYLDADLIEEI